MIAYAIRSLVQYLQTPAARTAEEFGDAIEEEIAFHVARRTRDYVAQGMSEEEAVRAAHAKFGNASQVAAECHAAAVGAPVFWHRLHMTLTAVLAGLVIIWLGSARSSVGPRAIPQGLPPGIASMLDNDWTGSITGRILDEAQQPIRDARVLVVVKTWPDRSYFQRAYAANTDIDGNFLIKGVYPINEMYEVHIAAVAEGRALKSSYHGDCKGLLEPLVLELPPSTALTLNVESETGDGLAGVEVLPHSRQEPSGAEYLVYFDCAQSLVQRTDANGCVQLSYLQPGDTASVLVRTFDGEWQPHAFVVPTTDKTVSIRLKQTPPSNHFRES